MGSRLQWCYRKLDRPKKSSEIREGDYDDVKSLQAFMNQQVQVSKPFTGFGNRQQIMNEVKATTV